VKKTARVTDVTNGHTRVGKYDRSSQLWKWGHRRNDDTVCPRRLLLS